eukprot:SAG31_NODE_43134_length_268_cov_0.905325_1_plen_70_part_01
MAPSEWMIMARCAPLLFALLLLATVLLPKGRAASPQLSRAQQGPEAASDGSDARLAGDVTRYGADPAPGN